jgi:hypothetical protein
MKKRRKYYPGEIIGSCKLIKMLPSKVFGTQGRKIGMGLFECSICATPFECMITSVKVGTKSCGCLAIKVTKETATKHGKSNTKEYRAWMAAKNRCYNENDHNYNDWGGRGIKMYDGWVNDFQAFFDYIGKAPSKKHSLDRYPNNDSGHYEPGNVRWATTKQQANNKRDNRIISYNGLSKTIREWSEETGMPYAVIQGRDNRGWEAHDIFNKPISLSSSIRHGSN